MDGLPVDMLCLIVLLLDDKQDVLRLSRVNRTLANNLAVNERLWVEWLTRHAPDRVLNLLVRRFRGERLSEALEQVNKENRHASKCPDREVCRVSSARESVADLLFDTIGDRVSSRRCGCRRATAPLLSHFP